MNGLRWAKELADHTLLLLGVALLTGGIALGGVLLHRPAWFLGVFGGLLLLAILFEGAFRTWDAAETRAGIAEAGLADENTRETVARRMDRFAREYEVLRAEAPPEKGVGGRMHTPEQANWVQSNAHLSEQISSELRQNAPGFVQYWRTNPEEMPPPHPFDAYVHAFVDMSVAQLAHTSQRLREGHDEP